jgi:hypothetical protein
LFSVGKSRIGCNIDHRPAENQFGAEHHQAAVDIAFGKITVSDKPVSDGVDHHTRRHYGCIGLWGNCGIGGNYFQSIGFDILRPCRDRYQQDKKSGKRKEMEAGQIFH